MYRSTCSRSNFAVNKQYGSIDDEHVIYLFPSKTARIKYYYYYNYYIIIDVSTQVVLRLAPPTAFRTPLEDGPQMLNMSCWLTVAYVTVAGAKTIDAPMY